MKAAADAAIRTLDRDLKEKKPSERVVPFTDNVFCKVAIEWLIATDQVICLFLGVVTLPCLTSFTYSQYGCLNTPSLRR